MSRELLRWTLRVTGLLSVMLVAVGCQVLPHKALSGRADQVIEQGFGSAPRSRFGSYPSSNVGTTFLGPDLGTHGYYSRPSEKDGIAYTCRGGTIDVIHIRIAADWTAYLTATTYRHLLHRDSGFSYKLAVDHSRSFLTITYPENWDSLPQDQQSAMAKEVALALGPYLTFTLTTWHEILTWYGYKILGALPEFPSAFSWEDSYSNLLGTIVAVHALQDAEHTYDDAVQIALDREMRQLGIQPAAVARQASQSVAGKWFTGKTLFLVTMRKRNFDIGLKDGYLTPVLIPGVAACPKARPTPYPVPKLDVLSRHGFSVKLEIEPHEWEKGKILRVVYGNQPQKRIIPEQHFPIIMDAIRQEASAMYPEFDYTADERGE